MRKYSHWTPKYILNRIRQIIYYRNHKHLPWLNKEANEYLDNIINKKYSVIEFGGGRSTNYFLQKVDNLITIEHDKYYYDKLRNQNLSLINKKKYAIYHLTKEDSFISFINKIKDQSIDLVLVDSMYRYSVVKNILSKIKDNGLLIIDNIGRFIPTNTNCPIDSGREKNKFLNQSWKDLFEQIIFKNYSIKITTDGVSDTAFIQKNFI